MNSCDDDEDNKAAFTTPRYPCMPSVVGIQQMRNRLHLAYAGQKLMNWTALTTGRELNTLAKEIHQSSSAFCEDLGCCYMLLARARYANPYINDIVLNNVPPHANLKVDACTKLISGVEVLQLQVAEGKVENYTHLGISRGGETLIEVKRHWRDLIRKAIQLCQMRITFTDLDKANKNATKQTCMLVERVIPDMNSNINAREDELEELKRDQLYRMKILSQKTKLGSETNSKGVLRYSLTGIIQDIAKKGDRSCHPECPFDCPKVDPMSIEQNSVFNIVGEQTKLFKRKARTPDEINKEDLSGCPVACIKMYEKLLAMDKPFDTEEKNGVCCSSLKDLQKSKPSVPMMTYDPGPGLVKCKLCREAKEDEEKKRIKDLEREKKAKREKKELELAERKKQEISDEVAQYHKEVEEMERQKKERDSFVDCKYKKKVCCSTSPIEELLPCPQCHAKTNCASLRKRPKPPPCPEVYAVDSQKTYPDPTPSPEVDATHSQKTDPPTCPHLAVTCSNVDIIKFLPDYNTVFPELNPISQSDENQRSVDAQVETGIKSGTKPTKSETYNNQPCVKTDAQKPVCISSTTSTNEEITPFPHSDIVFPRVDAITCPGCHTVCSKAYSEEKKLVYSTKTTSTLETFFICPLCKDVCPKKKGKPVCHSATLLTKEEHPPCPLCLANCPMLKNEEKKPVCCPKPTLPLKFSCLSKETEPMCRSATLLAKEEHPPCPLCLANCPMLKNEDKKPVCCPKPTLPLKCSCLSKETEPMCRSATTSIKEEISPCPLCLANCPMLKNEEKKPVCCPKPTLPLKCSCLSKETEPMCRSATTSIKEEISPCPLCQFTCPKLINEEKKPVCCPKTTSPIKMPSHKPVCIHKRTSPIQEPPQKHVCCPKTTSSIKEQPRTRNCHTVYPKKQSVPKVDKTAEQYGPIKCKPPVTSKKCKPYRDANKEVPPDCQTDCSKRRSITKVESKKSKKCRTCQETESIKTSTITINKESKATIATGTLSKGSKKSIDLTDLIIDDKGNVVIRSDNKATNQGNKFLSIKDVIEKGEAEFQRVQKLREALKIPCTQSMPCTDRCVYRSQKAAIVSVGQTTSEHGTRSARSSLNKYNISSSYNAMMKIALSELYKHSRTNVRCDEHNFSNITGESDKYEQTKRKLVRPLTIAEDTQTTNNQTNIKSPVKTQNSLLRPVIASYGTVDLPSKAGSVAGDHTSVISEERLEKVHVFLAQSPAFTHLIEYAGVAQKKESDDSYQDNNAKFGLRKRKKAENNTVYRFAKMLRNSVDKVRMISKSRDTIKEHKKKDAQGSRYMFF